MIKPKQYKAKSVFKGEDWEGYYIYSGYTNKHFIVQNAVETKIGMAFAHFDELDPETLIEIDTENTEGQP